MQMQPYPPQPTPQSPQFTFRDTSLWFPGATIRLSLEELQKPDIGRKYARVDKRPLDPPPVVRVRCYRIYSLPTGGTVEEEIHAYDEHLAFGLICRVDLFPVQGSPPGTYLQGEDPLESPSHTLPPFSFSFQPVMSGMPSRFPPTQLSSQLHRSFDPPAFLPSLANLTVSPSFLPAFSPPGFPSATDYRAPLDVRPKVQPRLDQTDVGYTAPSPESQCTKLLAGEIFANCSLVEHHGSTTAMFVFSDLAVKMEGHYFLRYQVFSVFGATCDPQAAIPVLAECYGGPFEIFSTKTFPGLQPSTELTRKLAVAGVRVNVRSKKRQGWRRTRTSFYHHEPRSSSEDGRHLPDIPESSGAAEGEGRAQEDVEMADDDDDDDDAAAAAAFPPPFLIAGPGRAPPPPPPCLLGWSRRSGELHESDSVSTDSSTRSSL